MRYEVTHTIVHMVEADSPEQAENRSRSWLDDEYWHREADGGRTVVREVESGVSVNLFGTDKDEIPFRRIHFASVAEAEEWLDHYQPVVIWTITENGES